MPGMWSTQRAPQGVTGLTEKNGAQFLLFESSTHWLCCRGSVANEGVINLVNIYGPHDLEVKGEFLA